MEKNVQEGITQEEQALNQLERQMERGGLHTHTIVSRNADRISEAESFLYGAIDILIDKGLLTEFELSKAAEKVRREMDNAGQTVGPGIALRVDGDESGPREAAPVNCAKRLPICKAVCCKLHFALSADEVESGIVKWDLGEPYHIRHKANGCCHHLDSESKGCSVYDNRPKVCRQYSCEKDKRVWIDFENMILNEEWIAENLYASKPRVVALQMLAGSTSI